MPVAAAEQLPLFTETGVRKSDRVAAPERRVRVFQDLLLDEGAWAAKEAAQFSNDQSFREHLVANLPQNSAVTRRRYAGSLLQWFFPGGRPDSFAARVWLAYGDEPLLREILRYLYLRAEALIGQCVAEALHPIAPNALIPHSYLHDFLRLHSGEASPKANKRLKANLRKLGILAPAKAGYNLLKDATPSATAVFLVFHHEFAAADVRSVEVPAVLANPFWKYLGLKSEDAVRGLLRQADLAGHLGKYVMADQLELVTPRYTLDEVLQKKVRL
jgi:hypothetical protein